MPLLVGFLLEQLDPEVGDAHGQPIVEADPAFFERTAQAHHAGDVLGDGDGSGVDLVDQAVGQLQVGDSRLVQVVD